MRRLRDYFAQPSVLRTVHGWATILWLVMAPVSAFTSLRHSIQYLVGLSVYAVVISHWGAWQTSRAEESIDNVIPQD
jgi:hypothetical protein